LYMSNSTLTMIPNYSKAFKNDWICTIGKVKKGESRIVRSDNLQSYIDNGELR
jgi:hypothetical protein